jgi:hypothetical protein
MENLEENYSHIKGWAVDADPENEPTYPIKKYTGDDHRRLNYERHTQQQSDVEILHSTERPSITSVFGTTVPPAGFSGNIRRMAFKYSEGQWGHWLLLILADRINMVEGIIDDISKGQFPNIIAERGWTAEWKYNRKGLLKKLALGVAVTSAFIAYSKTKSKRRSSLTS